MRRWIVRVELDDPDGYNAGELRDLVKWALEDDVHTENMNVRSITVEPKEGSESHVSSGRDHR